MQKFPKASIKKKVRSCGLQKRVILEGPIDITKTSRSHTQAELIGSINAKITGILYVYWVKEKRDDNSAQG